MPERRAKEVGVKASAKEAGLKNDKHRGVSVIVCTNRPLFARNLFLNYGRQLYKTKELVLVLNNNKMDLKQYRAVAKRYPNVLVYQIDESVSLGRCLNFAASKAKHPIIAKLDDDDYYSPYYLKGIVQCFNNRKTDVLGKNACYLYLKSRNLLLFYHFNKANRFTDMVMGSTLAFHRTVIHKVKFRNVSRGEDTYFFSDCIKHKLKIYSCDPFNYVCIRRPNRFSHTWSIDENLIMKHSKKVARTKDFTRYITRTVGDCGRSKDVIFKH